LSFKFCLSSVSLNETDALQIFCWHPDLRNDLEIMSAIAAKGFRDVLERAPASVLDDKDVMLAACSAEGSCFSLASHRLQTDTDIALAAIRSNTEIGLIFTLPEQLLKDNPQVVQAAIESYDGDEIDRFYRHLPPSVFHDRSVLLSWLNRDDCPFMDWDGANGELIQARQYSNDHEVIVALAKNLRGNIRNSALLKDRDFLRRCVAVEGRVLFYAAEPYRSDFELQLIAIGSNRRALFADEDSHAMGSMLFVRLAEFTEQVRERLNVADTFMLTFLRGIADVEHQRAAPAVRCHLSMLDTGGGSDIKRHIAEFSGISTGTELSLLRAALENLEFWGY